MLQLKSPGVYTQEIASGVRAIGGAPTAVALFVGPTKTGIDNRRVRISSFGDFERNFGGLDQGSSLTYSVLHFFANGGGEAFVIRVKPNGSTAAATSLAKDGDSAKSVTATALSSGAASGEIFVEIDPFGIGINPFETTPSAHDKTRFNLSLTDRATGRAERWGNLSTSSSNTRFAKDVIGDEATGSKLIAFAVDAPGLEGPRATGSIYRLKSPLPAAFDTSGQPVTFATAIKTTVTLRFRNADGDFDDSTTTPLGKVWSKEFDVYDSGENKPANAVEIAAQLKSRINAAIRADIDLSDAVKAAGVEVDVQEGGRFIRLRIGAIAAAPDAERVSDAMVTISGGAFFSQLLAANPVMVENVSRYRLGAKYNAIKIGGNAVATQVAAAVTGIDGTAGIQPLTKDFKDAVLALDAPDPFFNTLCLPDLVRAKATNPSELLHGEAKAIYEEAARICKNKHAFLLVDPFPDVTTAAAAESWKSAKFTLQNQHTAIYFPNIRVDDPLEPGAIRSHPPSGSIAGLFARTDAQFGVWQAPAGTEFGIAGAYGPSVVLSDDEHGLLNPIGVNVIRQFPVYGTVSFGSRTVVGLDVASDDYKYVPVRRMANYILLSLSNGLRWAVHKPNGEALWGQIRMAGNSFMQGLFRQGAFKGTSARDAYFVLCDSSTTTPTDIQQGIVNVQVGFAPLKPAEFVVISLRQIIQAAA